MIDFLSNPSWINPQIDFLIFLQNIRIGHFEFLDKFFLSITIFGEFWLPTVICAIVYWCMDYRAGVYLFSLEGINSMITHFVKMLACVYRPWVLSDKIHPSELAIPFAKGYSFPSGHSAMSSSVLGGVAFLLRKKKFICFLFICLVGIIGFSRLWLGVHTPQDVICGLLIGLTLVFVLNKLIDWAEEKPNRYLYLTLIINIIIISMIIYIKYFNVYPKDYIGGELLVDPTMSIHFTISVYGYIMGLLSGCFLCRRFFPYNPKEMSVRSRVIIGGIGIIFVVSMLRGTVLLLMNQEQLKYVFPIMTFGGFFVTLIYPLIFQSLLKLSNYRKVNNISMK